MLAALDQALRSVPLLTLLGVRAEEARAGYLVLRLPYGAPITNAAGAIHTAAIFALGEVAASVALATHPDLQGLVHLQRSSKIKYYAPSHRDVTAHTTITKELVAGVQEGVLTGMARAEVPVNVLDASGADIAELVVRFTFRSR